MLMRFHRWARDLGLAGASLRLFPDRWRLGAPSNHTHLALSRQSFEPLRIQRLGQEQHYLGPLNGPELLVVLPEAKAVGSVAMSMLGSDADLGVVLFTSRDASHYQQGQGTQLLHEIALICRSFWSVGLNAYDRFTHRCRTLPTLSERGAPA
ncbi:conserved protein, DUF484 family [Escherichia coli]|uniref:Conserved protein, DUF484 family n=1 Tax=Escherichia coli TaxID=562 RepID=A0A376TYI8_ECOLX|nr:conserved protein, DUF484 family [Escherichia coli]